MSNETTISDNLRHLLRINDELSISELARRTEIPQPTLHHLLNGTTKRPRRGVLEKLATFFSVSIPQLTGSIPLDTTLPEAIKNNPSLAIVPIIEWSNVTLWPNVDRSTKRPEIILDKKLGINAFAILMKYENLEPLFPEDSILVFDPSKETQDRDFALVLRENSKIVFNRLFIEKSEIYIKQDQADGNMNLIKIRPNVDRILGTLIEVRLHF